MALDYQAPAPWGGIWGVAGSYEEQPFDRTDVTPVTRRGARLMLRFDLLNEKTGGSDYDGAATVELKAGDAGKAIAAVRRRCRQ